MQEKVVYENLSPHLICKSKQAIENLREKLDSSLFLNILQLFNTFENLASDFTKLTTCEMQIGGEVSMNYKKTVNKYFSN